MDGTVHIIFIFFSRCTHCKRLHPTWEELAQLLNEDNKSIVTVAKVDCTQDTALCSEHDVTGYPTLKFFGLDRKEAVKFRGTRDLPSLLNFLDEQLGSSVLVGIISLRYSKKGADDEHKGLIELTDDTFKKHLSTGNHFVKFYAPWCGHCQRLAPTWEAVAMGLANDDSVKISKIDCTMNREACKVYDIKSYPTLLWIQNGEKLDKYQGQRSVDDLTEYIAEMKGTITDEVPPPPPQPASPVVSLTGDTFETGIQKGITFVKFFAPWCGHCKGLAPTWEELGKIYVTKYDINIAKVDCTLEQNKELCSDQEVDGFPTLLLYKDGRKISEYNGSRGLEDLIEFVTKHSSHDEL
ncbi:hypothetical protein AAG570_002596 [Ranatra chinensis]|uniref:Thioredoxin domain-containing protein n=1 Tax=Ranatra chinensis TaxID=642074 RepID=A0ABD0Y8Z1_9HEMI